MSVPGRRGQLVLRAVVSLVVCFSLFSLPAQVFAQGSEGKHWGIEASYTPTWKAHAELQKDQLFLEDWPLVEGSEFFIGVAHGKAHGGYWGVSYLRKPLKDGTQRSSTETNQFCSGPNNTFCTSFTSSSKDVMKGVYLDGVEWHYFIPIAKFANHVQIGVTAGAGAGFPKGTVSSEFTSTVTTTQPGKPPQVDTHSDSSDQTAAEYMYKVTWLARAEVQGSFNIGPGLRAIVAGGVDAPSAFAFRVGVVYLIGGQ